ncbi:MAG: phosphoribosylformylglycinamidine cyclo-ligase [Ileibacterium sp.]|nr:phosphoribosylformylglycinamidine cyclo-ligase [Ileibacterium sp.]
MADQYKEAGVSLEAGYDSVRRIKSHVARTQTPGAIDSLGAFGGMFDLKKAGFQDPVLVSGTDGVGTKLMLAFAMDKHDTIGIDAVAMCVNDVLVQGAAPLFFLDYIAVGKNHPEVIEQIVKGVADGCVLSDAALIGGETAEMPDMYDIHHYDLAGFCVGAADRQNLIDGTKVQSGDVLIGLPSSGVHSNGFSLVRKVLFKDNQLDPKEAFEELDGKRLGDVLLEPTKIYVKPVKTLFGKEGLHGMAHITGGGFFENIPRMLNEGQGVEIELNSFPKPAIFDFIQKRSSISDHEMYNVFNMGIGFVIAAAPDAAEDLMSTLKEAGQESYVIGKVTDSGEVVLK